MEGSRAAAVRKMVVEHGFECSRLEQALLAQAYQKIVPGDGLVVDDELRFIDDGYSGSTLVRPALERLRDVAYAGGIDRLYVHSPDRLARRYHQDATTSSRPSRRASLPSLGGTSVALVVFAPRRPSAPSRPGVGHPVSPSENLRGNELDLPSSSGTPIVRLHMF